MIVLISIIVRQLTPSMDSQGSMIVILADRNKKLAMQSAIAITKGLETILTVYLGTVLLNEDLSGLLALALLTASSRLP